MLARGMDLDAELMHSVMLQIMEGQATDAQTGALLMGLRVKGETVDEITGAAQVMHEKVVPIRPSLSADEPLLDTCGTGGDGASTFNVSTTAAFVAAGAGVKVAKHGNRSVSSRSGSADVLEALGVSLDLPPEEAARAVEEAGIGFLFAPALHPAMKHAIGPRRELGIRTIFNVLGPLTNPAGADCQVLGVYDPALVRPIAQVLGRLGTKKAWVVHGEGGLDEISPLGATAVAELNSGNVREFSVTPSDFGVETCSLEDISGKGPEDNARIILDILSGTRGPKRDMVIMNAAAAILVADKAETMADASRAAAESIDSGQAMAALEKLRSFGK
jgi:anthranilate phosphoribosyltransferase